MGQLNPFLKEKFKKEFSVNYLCTKGWGMQDYHFHDGYEINFPLTENIKWFAGDRLYSVKSGDLFLFNTMDLHRAIIPPDMQYERYIISFKPEFIDSLSTGETDLLECFHHREGKFSHCIHLNTEQVDSLLPLLKKAEFYSNNEELFGRDVYLKITLTEILLLINNFYRSGNPVYSSKNQGEYNRVRPVIQYIHKNVDSDLSLDTLSKEFFMSKFYLGLLFKKATGLTINEYIINYRIMMARELLKKDISVSLAGEKVGYCNTSHFIRTFKKLTGLSPKQYAKQNNSY
jgi:AraC-type DNA-binding domain-containing proteins